MCKLTAYFTTMSKKVRRSKLFLIHSLYQPLRFWIHLQKLREKRKVFQCTKKLITLNELNFSWSCSNFKIVHKEKYTHAYRFNEESIENILIQRRNLFFFLQVHTVCFLLKIDFEKLLAQNFNILLWQVHLHG